jgi:hypothetical protein
MHAGTGKSLKTTFSTRFMPRLYSDIEWLLLVLSRIISSCYLATINERPEDYRE